MSVGEVMQADKTLDNWDIPVAAYNILRREGLNDIDKLITKSERELSELRGFSTRPHTFEVLIQKIHNQGYQLTSYINWKLVPIPGLKPGYSASRDGRINSPNGRDLKPIITRGKARISVVMEDGKSTSMLQATMVLSAFAGYRSDHDPVFIDGDPLNCAVSNLMWTAQPVKRSGRKRRITEPLLRDLNPESLAPTGGDKVETYRMYVSDDVTASISDDGTGSIKVGSTTVSLTNRQLKSLVLVAGRIGEVNSLMGIG